jgi:galactokinase
MSEALRSEAASRFAARFGRAAQGTVFVPGRVNLIGEHVDYNGGLVLPMPVRSGTAIAWARRADGEVRAIAAEFGDAEDSFALAAPSRPDAVDWRAYVRGAAACAPALPVGGMDLLIAGDLPRGAGLSSSASLCVAVARALAEAGDAAPAPIALARAAQRAEHEWAGVACGIMDQMAVAAGEPGAAMLLDCHDLTYRLMPLPPDWTVAVLPSGVTRGLVEGEYNARRAQCESAARKLGVAALREADAAMIERAALDPLERRRALHVVTEIERVRAATRAIEARDLPAFAAILREGHASLRDLFEVSVPQVDALVDQANAALGDHGGARLTGAGFGGSIVLVFDRSEAGRLGPTLQEALQPVV